MNRRRFLVAAGSAFAMRASRARAQSGAPPRIVWFSGGNEAATMSSFLALRAGLRDLGHREGDTIVVEPRWASFSPERAATLATEIAALRPRVIVTQGLAHGPATRLSPPIPVVFLHSGDPVAAGLADSFARPGRNATGISLMALDLIGKRLEILREIIPSVRRIAFLANPEHPGEQRELAASRAAAAQLGLAVTYYQVRTPAEIDRMLPLVAQARPDAACLFSDGLMLGHREALAAFFLKQRLPSVTGWASFAESGHLLSYGPNVQAAWRRVAYFVDRIIKGASPAELPIELPSVLELVVNRRTATVLNLVLPPAVLLRADRVVE